MTKFESYLALLAWAIKAPIAGEFSAIFYFCDGYSHSTFSVRRGGPKQIVTGLKSIKSHIGGVA